MESFLLTFSLAALWIALGEYVIYNLIILAAGLMRHPEPSADFTPPISVIIPAHNEELHIRRKLENVLYSHYPGDLLEIIVVDDGSTDRTSEIVREFESRGVRLISMDERKGKIFAQKTAFSQASNDIVAITDATVLVPPDGLKKLASHLADPSVGAVSARIMVRNRAVNYLTRAAQFLFDIQNAQKFGESMLDSAGGLFGQFSLLRREAVGDFSTDVIYEDREFGIVLRERGYRARFEPAVSVTYYAPESLEDFSRQKQRNIGAMTQSLIKHLKLLYNPRYGWYGMLIFPEYSLFRTLRVYLLLLAFLGALIHCIAAGQGYASLLLGSMVVSVLGGYFLGTALLAPLVSEPEQFLLDIFASVPAMALVAVHLVTAGPRYFRGDFTSLWKRVKRDRADDDEDASA